MSAPGDDTERCPSIFGESAGVTRCVSKTGGHDLHIGEFGGHRWYDDGYQPGEDRSRPPALTVFVRGDGSRLENGRWRPKNAT